jgi:hypothetical protein
VQARWPREQVRIEGDATEYVFGPPTSPRSARFFFCCSTDKGGFGIRARVNPLVF